MAMVLIGKFSREKSKKINYISNVRLTGKDIYNKQAIFSI